MNVLVYGDGQLAQMMYLAGTPLGIAVNAVDVKTNTVVHPVSKAATGIDLSRAIAKADALTVEFEHVPEALLKQASATGKLMPNIESILVGADRVREKQLLESHAIPNCKHIVVDDLAMLDRCVEQLGEKLIIKASRDGYDGYGQWRLQQASQLPEIKQQLASLDLHKVPLVVEQMVSFERELSLLGVRNIYGDVKVYPLAENLHHKGQLHVSVAPASDITAGLQQQAQEIFTTLADALDYVGVLAVEMFQCGDQLLVNELAPRVHNSGHWSIEGADVSQFESHLRALNGLPMGNIDAQRKSAMINIIGCDEIDLKLLGIPGCHFHWYGKSVREKRKMGHITLTANTYQALGEKLEMLSKYVPNEHFPMLLSESAKLKQIDG